MSKRPNPALVGAFILGAAALVILAITVWGSGRLFERRYKYLCYFPGSVHGLQIGAPVKYRGVAIGEVVDMRVRFEQAADDYHIPVFVELKDSRIKELGNSGDDPKKLIEKLVQNGLRARLDSESLVTGQLYVNLEYFPNTPATLVHAGGTKTLKEIPTVPQQLEELTKSISAFVDQLKKVDLAGIAKALEGAVQGIERVVNTPSIAKTLDELPATVAAIKHLMTDLDSGVGHVGPELHAALDPRGPLFSELGRTFQDVQHAAQSIRAFADFLQRNPNALIVGKKKP
jgi:paraquat-inducible protein B